MKAAITVRHVGGADAEVLSTVYPVPGLGIVPVNAYLLRAREPVLVDTGAIVFHDEYLDALRSTIDLGEVRWIYLTHTDADHIGCLRDVLDAAPRARVVTTFLGLGKLGLHRSLPPERAYLLNPGQRLSIGDRELCALRPPIFDAPETTAFVDSKTGVLFSSDCFGAVLSAPAENAADIPPAALREGAVLWATVDSPWLANVPEEAVDAKLAEVRALAPPIVLSSHLPPAFGMLDVLLEHVASARTAAPFVGPDQRALASILASVATTAEPAHA